MNEGQIKPRAPRGNGGTAVSGEGGTTVPGEDGTALPGRADPLPGAARTTGPDSAGGERTREACGRSVQGAVPGGWGRYLVAPRPLGLLPGMVPPIDFPVLLTLLEEDEQARVLDQIRPARSRGLGAISEPHPACPPVAVVAMPPERARVLAANPQVVVEADQALHYPAAGPGMAPVPVADPALAVTLTEPAALTVRVVDRNQAPVAGARVWAAGSGGTAYAISDHQGLARVQLGVDTPQTVQAVYVRPESGFWPAAVSGTALPQDATTQMTVVVRALSEDFDGFPGKPVTGWGAQAMRLSQLPPNLRGHGIRIALIDSGIAAAHPDLKDQIIGGYDFTAGTEDGWEKDATGNGTRCAGLIGAADNRGGITGIACDADLFALKVFPNGRTSHLLQALDWCITHHVDVTQINLAQSQPSQLLAWKILDLRAAGTVPVAPAGDTGAVPAFPAALPTVLAVGALAHTGTTPTAPAPAAGQLSWAGPYSPASTPAGADLIAPGSAVITLSQDGDYTPADSTAMAAAHVTALLALLLAHHDQLRAVPARQHSQGRAEDAVSVLRASCRPVIGTDPSRTGAGLPDAPTALALTTTAWPTTLATAAGQGAPAFAQ